MIQANPKHTIIPIIVAVTALVVYLVNPPGRPTSGQEKIPASDSLKHSNDSITEPVYFIHQGTVFGTYYNIRYEATRDLEEEVKQALTDFDNSLSLFNPHSILSAINANRDTVTNEAFESMFEEAARVHQLSRGAFDITVAPLVNYWGFGNEGRQTESRSQKAAIDSIMTFVGFNKVRLINHHIVKSDKRIKLDAGAVAKGQACDMIAQVLHQQGCQNYLVDIGGEVVAKGLNAQGQPWSIGITKPSPDNQGVQTDGWQEILHLTDACLATSGNYLNYYYAEGERRSHTIDPRTGYPVQHSVLSATVISSSCMRADALATSCMVLGAEQALDMIARAKDAACLLIVLQNGQLNVLTSPNWTEKTAK